MQQNLIDVENIINPQKSIFSFDRAYNSIELYVRIIEMNSYFVVRLKKSSYNKKEVKLPHLTHL